MLSESRKITPEDAIRTLRYSIYSERHIEFQMMRVSNPLLSVQNNQQANISAGVSLQFALYNKYLYLPKIAFIKS